MSQFDTDVANACHADLKAVHGQAITYKESGQSDNAITALYVTEREPVFLDDDDGRFRRREIIVGIASSDEATPIDAGQITYDSIDWEIEIVDPVAGGWRIVAVYIESAERNQGAYRIRR